MTARETSLPTPSSISVVIPTINRAEVLLDTLRDLAVQVFDDWEVIVIDQSDTENVAAQEILAGFAVPHRYVRPDFRGLPQARNAGWRAAVKDIVLYIDDDIRCGPGFLQAHLDAHRSSGAALIAGGITEAKGDRTARGGTGTFNWWTATSVRNFHLPDAGFCLHAPGGNFCIRRDVLAAIGGLDEQLALGAALYEETELALRLRTAGHRCWFAPAAQLTHLAAPMGGCRVPRDVPRYMHGLAHNRALLIYRHLRPWHRPTALLRLFALGLSYSRADRSLAPLRATVTGMRAGRQAARRQPAPLGPTSGAQG